MSGWNPETDFRGPSGEAIPEPVTGEMELTNAEPVFAVTIEAKDIPQGAAQIAVGAFEAVLSGTQLTLSVPHGQKLPAGFPRAGELLSVGSEGNRNLSFDPTKVLAWVHRCAKAGWREDDDGVH